MNPVKHLLRNLALYAFSIGFTRPILKWVAGVRYRRKNLVPDGPCVVVSNHNSHLDAALLMGLFPLARLPHVHPVAAADYFGKSWFMRTVAMLMMNALPIERRSTRATDPMAPFVEVLKQGESLILFPEGSRGEAGVVARFRPGVGILVRSVPGLLVVPVFLAGPERIWPRGELVPVPHGIDAIVGKPRTYDSSEEPRLIADHIREDVLALAPPPPPVPGPRPAPPLRVAVCGTDDAARREVFRAVCERLGRVAATLGLGDPVLEADERGVREVTAPMAHGSGGTWTSLLAWLFRIGSRQKMPGLVPMIERERINEAFSLARREPLVVTEGSALIDLMAWANADLYGGGADRTQLNRLMRYVANQQPIPTTSFLRYLRRAPEVWLINQFDLVNPPAPDVLVHLTSPVAHRMQRLRSQGRKVRNHETETFLERWETAQGAAARFLAGRRRMEFLAYDVSRTAADEIARDVAERCLPLLEKADDVEPARETDA